MLNQGLQIPFGIQPVNPVPVDAWSGPYGSVEEALSSIPSEVRFPTMQVRILSDTGNEVYWFKDGIEDDNLILFDLTTNIQFHTGNTDNPHKTTAQQVGSYTSGETEQLIGVIDAKKLDISGGTVNGSLIISGVGTNNVDNLLIIKNDSGDTVSAINGLGVATFKDIYKSDGTSEQYLMGDGSIRKQHKEIITENINGINVLFSISNVFISNSVSVYLNGIKEIYFTEVDNNKIQFQEAPKNNGFVDLIEVHYLSNE